MSEVTTVEFSDGIEIRAKILSAFSVESNTLSEILPYAEVNLVGASSVSGLLNKGDVDINIRVERDKFSLAEKILAENFVREERFSKEGEFAAFSDEIHGVPVDLFLCSFNSEYDFFVPVREFLRSSAIARESLNALKSQFHGCPMEQYRAAKDDFFTRIRFILAEGLLSKTDAGT